MKTSIFQITIMFKPGLPCALEVFTKPQLNFQTWNPSNIWGGNLENWFFHKFILTLSDLYLLLPLLFSLEILNFLGFFFHPCFFSFLGFGLSFRDLFLALEATLDQSKKVSNKLSIMSKWQKLYSIFISQRFFWENHFLNFPSGIKWMGNLKVAEVKNCIRFYVQIFWEGHKNLKKSLTLFWHYIQSNLKKKVRDFFKYFGLLTISEL